MEDYFRSLTRELEALRDRIRFLIEDRHWQTDGEWKESVLRQILRRHLGASAGIGRGFIVSASGTSHQIDLLIWDASKPVLFRDGDLAIVTPDAVLGVVEVKARVTPSTVAKAAAKLATDMSIVRAPGNTRAVAGIFAFESKKASSAAYLQALSAAAEHSDNRVDFACLGCHRFLRYWELDPHHGRHFYEGWRSYALSDMAAGYFIHNLIEAMNPHSVGPNQKVWFPSADKQLVCEGEVFGRWPSQRPTAS